MSSENYDWQSEEIEFQSHISEGHVDIDPDLVAEFKNKNGDIELICQDGVVISCHACVLTYQSNIIRTSLKHTGNRLECKKYPSSTMTKLIQMMYSEPVVFTCRYELFQVLFAAVFYNVKWLSKEVQSAIEVHCTKGHHYEPTNANNCRDALLVLQENITYSVEEPNPGYAPYDPSIKPLTEKLADYLVYCAGEGFGPADFDTVAVVNSIYEYLDKEVNDRCFDVKGPITNLLGLVYGEVNMNKNDIFNAVLRRDAILTKYLLKIERDTVYKLMSSREKLGKEYKLEVALTLSPDPFQLKSCGWWWRQEQRLELEPKSRLQKKQQFLKP